MAAVERKCRDLAARLIVPLRETAREHGYALGVHGSLARDIDLIAVPWTVEACSQVELAEAIRQKAEEVCGFAFINPREKSPYAESGRPGCKPHGRLAWAFHLGGGPYIDLSIMPPTGQEASDEQLKRFINKNESFDPARGI